ncbi:hypothetical protein ON010_g5183 [Phytophthora cinnamomi]|nr:hypothetical protein ON010_g5183 [Phytophthora cinnamomi]
MVHVTGTSSILAVAALVAVAASSAEGVAFNCPGINYNIRAGADWAAPQDKCKPASQIANELEILKKYTNVLRLYSLTDCDQATAVVPGAIAAGFQLELGLTGVVTPDNIVGIHVGSEAIYRGDVDYDTAVSHLSTIRQMCTDIGGAVNVPLSITDVGNTYLAYPQLIDEVDYVSANLFPFWDRIVPTQAASYFLSIYERLVDLTTTRDGNKSVVIGETGWATNGSDARASEATPENSARYSHDFYLQAQEKGITYYYFSAFDEPWKGANTVEAYFGLFHEDGKMKSTIEVLQLDNETAGVSETKSTEAEAGASINSTSSRNATDASTPGDEEFASEAAKANATDASASTADEIAFESAAGEIKTDEATVTSESASGASDTSSSDASPDGATLVVEASEAASVESESSNSIARAPAADNKDCAMI